jgi:hypothetical protein
MSDSDPIQNDKPDSASVGKSRRPRALKKSAAMLAFKNDPRSKAGVLYVEPGGYYEHELDFGKPIVACVVGRWKSKLMLGCLSHCGYSHGGNGFEGIAFLIEEFSGVDLENPADPNHGLDLKAMAKAFAERYKLEKSASKESGAGEPRALPGVHHPIFKGKPVNYDPRERFIADFMAKRDDYNVFHAYYRELVQALYDVGASPYVFCVNVDAVIAALLLTILWKDFRSGVLTEKDLETAAFNVFLYGRMIGAAAEIDDHLNRGRNMDTRTPLEQCGFVV